MIQKILFAGIDGSGKSTCLDLLISRLESQYSIIKVGNGDPYLYFRGERRLAIKNRCYWIMSYMRPISKRYHFHGLFLIGNFLYKFLLLKYVELLKTCDLIMYETDVLLHPAVYITYHFPFSKRITPNLRLKLVNMLSGSKRNCSIFYLDTDPELAMERIYERGADIHEHENPRDLCTLKREFDSIVEVALKNGFRIFRISTNHKTMDEVADDIQMILETRLSRAG